MLVWNNNCCERLGARRCLLAPGVWSGSPTVGSRWGVSEGLLGSQDTRRLWCTVCATLGAAGKTLCPLPGPV